MGKFGVNVPKGVAVSSLDEVRKAIQSVFPNESEVIVCNSGHWGLSSLYFRQENNMFLVSDRTEKMSGRYKLFISLLCFRRAKQLVQCSCIFFFFKVVLGGLNMFFV